MNKETELIDLGEIMIFYDSEKITGMHFRNKKGKLIGAFGKQRYTDSITYKDLEEYPKEDPRKLPPH